MFMNDVQKKEEIRNIAISDLRGMGVKYRPKKNKHNVQETKTRKVFRVALQYLPMQIVTLSSGQQLTVPKIVHELCSYVLTKVDTEGLFRKGGSKSRQNEIKLSLDAGCCLGDEHHEIDVASVLKTFFRELPEPLIPYSHHEVFLRCMLLGGNQMQAILLSCLLLPCEHLNTLSYFMQFLRQVSEFSPYNKMDAYNLAVVIGPTLMPVDEKVVANTARVNKICELVKVLIDSADKIGVLPSDIIERVALSTSTSSLVEDDLTTSKKKKKRRSGSLTRMFNGLKKMVSSKSEDPLPDASITPDLLMTPSLSRSAKKRKMENGLSAKKRKEILHNLPQKTALSTPFTPIRTPISINPNPKKNGTPDTCHKSNTYENKIETAKEKKLQWYQRSKSKKTEDDQTSVNSRTGGNTKSMLERRWSAVSQVASFKRNKKRNSCAGNLQHAKVRSEINLSKNHSPKPIFSSEIDISSSKHKIEEPDYVRISKTEYEEIKNRVSEIERQISTELEKVDYKLVSENVDRIENVVTAYEKTLVETEPLSPTTDQLAKRFSRELKIRRSAEQRVFRSPSARKIGTIRRRSRELERQNSIRLSRHQSWHAGARANLRRGRPNTVMTGLIKTPVKSSEEIPMSPETSNQEDQIHHVVTRSSSFKDKSFSPATNSIKSTSSASRPKLDIKNCVENTSNASEHWLSAEGFFTLHPETTPSTSTENCRSSIAKLRSQNAGMVLAKARLFDEMVDSDSSSQQSASQIKLKPGNKIGNNRHADRQAYRVRTLRADERRMTKNTVSPRRRNLKSPTNRTQKLQLARVLQEQSRTQKGKENSSHLKINSEILGAGKVNPLRDVNRVADDLLRTPACCNTPTGNSTMPPIRKPLITKSPKRLHRTPNKTDNKPTPLKAVSTPRYNY